MSKAFNQVLQDKIWRTNQSSVKASKFDVSCNFINWEWLWAQTKECTNLHNFQVVHFWRIACFSTKDIYWNQHSNKLQTFQHNINVLYCKHLYLWFIPCTIFWNTCFFLSSFYFLHNRIYIQDSFLINLLGLEFIMK